ncbi:MAG TPA: ABC transporter permease [Nitrososphaerales archaeon]|nr:ABC transporter permease [Nitrososphaerales archaeon]
MSERESKEPKQPPKRSGTRAAYVEDLKYSLSLLVKNKLVLTGIILSIFFILVAIFSNIIVNPASANKFDFGISYCWNGNLFSWGTQAITCPASVNYPLGSDGYGRSLLSMIVLAIPLDLSIALEIVASALAIGILLGSVAAYAGGWVDEAILRVTDIFFAFPFLILALVFAAVLGRTIPNLELAIFLVWWPVYVRLIRGQMLSEKNKAYVEALRALGVSRWRTLFFHLIPNSIYPLLVQATLDIGGVILTFSALVFLGFSPSPALPELGNLAADGINQIFTAPWLLVIPGLVILLISLGFNLVGDGLRDVLDPRLRR